MATTFKFGKEKIHSFRQSVDCFLETANRLVFESRFYIWAQVRDKMRLDGQAFAVERMPDIETLPDIPRSGNISREGQGYLD